MKISFSIFKINQLYKFKTNINALIIFLILTQQLTGSVAFFKQEVTLAMPAKFT